MIHTNKYRLKNKEVNTLKQTKYYKIFDKYVRIDT